MGLVSDFFFFLRERERQRQRRAWPQLLKLNQELTWRVLTQVIRPEQSKGSLLVLGSLTLQKQHVYSACLTALCGTQTPVDSLQPLAVLLYQEKLLGADQKEPGCKVTHAVWPSGIPGMDTSIWRRGGLSALQIVTQGINNCEILG